jgi:hypothetical protein
MKISLALGQRQQLSRQTAWGFLTTNLALPGFGSLAAGRKSGYFQAVLTIIGMALTMIFGLRFIAWSLSNWSRLHDPTADQFAALGEMWLVVRWALLGIGIFALGWIWALGTSLGILRESGQPQHPVPPRLT